MKKIEDERGEHNDNKQRAGGIKQQQKRVNHDSPGQSTAHDDHAYHRCQCFQHNKKERAKRVVLYIP